MSAVHCGVLFYTYTQTHTYGQSFRGNRFVKVALNGTFVRLEKCMFFSYTPTCAYRNGFVPMHVQAL